MEMEGPWELSVSVPENKYLFNGIERASDFGLDWDIAMFRSYDAAIGRWMQVDPKSESFSSVTPYNGLLNNPIKIVDMLGDSSWPVTRQWSAQDYEGYQNFVNQEVQSMQDNGEKIDCADLTCALLIRYAAQEGVEVEFTKTDGSKVNSSSDEASSANEFESLVRGSTNAESIQADMAELPYLTEPIPGDMTNSSLHVNVVRSRGENEVIADDKIPSTSGSLPDRVPKNSSIDNYRTFKRFHVMQTAKQKNWNQQKAVQRKRELRGDF